MTKAEGKELRLLMEETRGRLSSYKSTGVEYHNGANPSRFEYDIAMPYATQNELNGADAKKLVKDGVIAVAEGANMPTTIEAIKTFREGGVAASGLEQSQNAMRISWGGEEVDKRLQDIMENIHHRCVENGGDGEIVDYIDGSNLAGFKKVARAMLAYGAV